MKESVQRPDEEVQFIESEIRPSTAVIEATAEFLDRDPLELQTLEQSVDPDALDGLFGGTDARAAVRTGVIEFGYQGLDVTVDFGADDGFRVELRESSS